VKLTSTFNRYTNVSKTKTPVHGQGKVRGVYIDPIAG